MLSVLKEEGYIRDFKDIEERKGISSIKIDLKYYNGTPVIKRIKRISKPGIRVYSKISELEKPWNETAALRFVNISEQVDKIRGENIFEVVRKQELSCGSLVLLARCPPDFLPPSPHFKIENSISFNQFAKC